MITEEIEITNKEKAEYPPLQKNVYQAQIFDINLKDATGQYSKPGEKVFTVQFTLLDGMEKEKSLRGRNVWDNFIPTYLYIGKSGKNKLYGIIEAVLGRDVSPNEVANFDKSFVNSLIGQQVRIMVEPKKVGDRIFDNITDYLSVSTKLNELTPEEKEKSKVKEKSKIAEVEETIPTIQLDDEVRIEDVPF